MYSQLGYLIEALKTSDSKEEEVLIAKGKYQYPKTIKEAFAKGWR